MVCVQEFDRRITSHQAVVSKLLESGTFLIHFANKDHLVDINDTLRHVHNQWKQLIFQTEAHGRRLAIACRHDKRVN